jgi:hypothetical protein
MNLLALNNKNVATSILHVEAELRDKTVIFNKTTKFNGILKMQIQRYYFKHELLKFSWAFMYYSIELPCNGFS